MDKLIEGIENFRNQVFPRDRELFQKLAHGQSPRTLVVTCADSRIALELMTQTSPGDLFVCRNAGNIVPLYGKSDGASASIEYALSVLPIRDIIVCGHSDCGAMKGLVNPAALREMPLVRDWLAHSHTAVMELEWEGTGLHSPEVLNQLAKRNVRLQVEHLNSYPKVLSRVRDGSLQVHGWFYRIDAGEIESYDIAANQWNPIRLPEKAPLKTRAAGSQEVQHG